jgi:hypothetical protein
MQEVNGAVITRQESGRHKIGQRICADEEKQKISTVPLWNRIIGHGNPSEGDNLYEASLLLLLLIPFWAKILRL